MFSDVAKVMDMKTATDTAHPARCACVTCCAARAAAAPCIYCQAPGPTNDACACAVCAQEMGLDAPAAPAPRCPDCGEFAPDCDGHHGRPAAAIDFGYGGRVHRAGQE
jgi:hypothetical protein